MVLGYEVPKSKLAEVYIKEECSFFGKDERIFPFFLFSLLLDPLEPILTGPGGAYD